MTDNNGETTHSFRISLSDKHQILYCKTQMYQPCLPGAITQKCQLIELYLSSDNLFDEVYRDRH